jgi:hypothetical protein
MDTRPDTTDAAAWLARHAREGATTDEALAFFDGLSPLGLDELRGRWRGSGLHTGHRLDGLLEAFGWYGKQFDDPESVHPLLFEGLGGVVDVDSRYLPMGLMTMMSARYATLLRPAFAVGRQLLRTRAPRARLRMMEHRGVVTATMIYDYAPIHDVFRRVDGDTALGLMDLRGVARPFFFVLRRA